MEDFVNGSTISAQGEDCVFSDALEATHSAHRKSRNHAELLDVLIIGGGPAGLLSAMSAAGFSTENQRKILILEKMPTPGRKLLIAGSGRCNLTSARRIQDFFSHYGAREKERFVKPALLNFTNLELLQLLQKNDLPCVQLNDGKIFPKSERSRDVLELFLRLCADFHVEIQCGEAAVSLEKSEDGTFLAHTDAGKRFRARRLIVAVGGKSFPTTGASGDGERFARQLGLALVPLRPALTSATVADYDLANCAGISFQEVSITLWRSGKKMASRVGDVLLTHRGLSGPGILDFSRDFLPGDVLKIAFVPEMTDQELASLLQKNPQRDVGNLIRSEFALSGRFVVAALKNVGVDVSLKCGQITKTQRRTILALLTEFPFKIQSVGGFREAMATAGGIALSEIDRRSMESRKTPGLFFAGEVLDVDGDTGGFNLQFAFSSGFTAGKSALESLAIS